MVVTAPTEWAMDVAVTLFEAYVAMAYCMCVPASMLCAPTTTLKAVINSAWLEGRLLMISGLEAREPFVWVCVFRTRELRDWMCKRGGKQIKEVAVCAKEGDAHEYIKLYFTGLK